MAPNHYSNSASPEESPKRAQPRVADIISKLKRKRDDGGTVGDAAPEKTNEQHTGEKDERKKKKSKRELRFEAEDTETVPEVIGKEKREKRDKKDKGERKRKRSKKSQIEITTTLRAPEEDAEEVIKPAQKPPTNRKYEKRQKKPNFDDINDSGDALSRHKSIRQKLSKVKVKASQPSSTTEPTTAEEESIQVAPVGLEPLPQPAPIKAPKHSVTLASSLPPWLASPTIVTPTATVPFISIPGLSSKILSRLDTLQLPYAFAVQSVVIPLLLKSGAGDVCISAATGSGKTLSYILPIVQLLSTRIVTRLRAIVVVPTRELVSQVFSTASSLTSGTGIKVCTAVGTRALTLEQELLVDVDQDGTANSKVDILITTPGRLVEHIKNTPGFSLQWIKWLVIDEADRLLAQSFQEWVDVVVGAVEQATSSILEEGDIADVLENLGVRVHKERGEVRKVVLSATMTRDAGKLAGLKLRRPTMVVVENAVKSKQEAEDGKKAQDDNGDDDEHDEEDVSDEVFSVPMELREFAVAVVDTEYKPLNLMYLIRDRGIKKGTVVFVKSNEGAARLARLIEAVLEGVEGLDKAAGWTIGLITGEMEKKRRDKVMKAFKRNEVHILIASDLISRGLDLPNIEHIINYDIPSSTRAYVHRVGRTARAGKGGDAFTLVADKEARWFWRNVSKGIRRREEGVERLTIKLEDEGLGWRRVYEGVLHG